MRGLKSVGKKIIVALSIMIFLFVLGIVMEKVSSGDSLGKSPNKITGYSVASVNANDKTGGIDKVSAWAIAVLALGLAGALAFGSDRFRTRVDDGIRGSEVNLEDAYQHQIDELFAEARSHFINNNYNGMQNAVNSINILYKNLPQDLKRETHERLLEFYEEIRR